MAGGKGVQVKSGLVRYQSQLCYYNSVIFCVASFFLAPCKRPVGQVARGYRGTMTGTEKLAVEGRGNSAVEVRRRVTSVVFLQRQIGRKATL
ncbi:hypothetical protein B0I35DRAFT_38291 [Stachybotrys elegans]|uniref:Uncharacterized protein n=1 Tax=Stachybotrys elegans TaxID=80388 RepID=A0A8K0T8L2_9HYPO|nr:hypothetical protein B0I35DRAFT_38291 [Stachybotrys elegans]